MGFSEAIRIKVMLPEVLKMYKERVMVSHPNNCCTISKRCGIRGRLARWVCRRHSQKWMFSSAVGQHWCWRSSRGNDYQLTLDLDLGSQRLPTPSFVLGMYALFILPTVGAIFNYVALRELCVVKIIRIAYMSAPNQGLYIIETTTYQSVVVCLFLWSLFALSV